MSATSLGAPQLFDLMNSESLTISCN